MKSIIAVLVLVSFLVSCASLPESNIAAQESAWELAYQVEDLSDLVFAVVDFETTDVPEALASTYRNDLSTNLSIAFRESESSHKVVTRTRVDAVLEEQSMVLQGLTARDAGLKIGELLGADVLVTGNIIWLEDDLYRASVQLIETDDGLVLGGDAWDFWFDTESED